MSVPNWLIECLNQYLIINLPFTVDDKTRSVWLQLPVWNQKDLDTPTENLGLSSDFQQTTFFCLQKWWPSIC